MFTEAFPCAVNNRLGTEAGGWKYCLCHILLLGLVGPLICQVEACLGDAGSLLVG